MVEGKKGTVHVEASPFSAGQNCSDYVEKLCVGVVGSRMLVELLWRAGIGTIKHVGDFITPSDVFSDVSLSMDDANDYDVVESRGKSLIIPVLAEKLEERLFLNALRGCDIVIAHRYCKLAARIAERFGVPFVPPAVTCVLPEDLKYLDLSIFEEIRPENPALYAMLCSAQVIEVLKLCVDGSGIIAPEALVPVKDPPFFRKVELW